MIRPIRRAALALLVCAVVAIAGAGVVLGETALTSGHRRPAVPAAVPTEQARRLGAQVTGVAIDDGEGVRLSAWHFERPSSRATVIVTHGVTGSRAHALAYADFLLPAGYDVLAPDARGHGDSGGVATYGVREADDVAAWVRWLRQRDRSRCVAGIGASMGAAHLIVAAPTVPDLRAIVADSAFTTFREAALDRIARHVGIGLAGRLLGIPVVSAGMLYVGLRYGIDLRDASPIGALPRLSIPVLLVHGGADVDTPVSHADALHAAQPATELWIVPNATHTAAWRAEPREYPRRILEFLDRVPCPPSPALVSRDRQP